MSARAAKMNRRNRPDGVQFLRVLPEGAEIGFAVGGALWSLMLRGPDLRVAPLDEHGHPGICVIFPLSAWAQQYERQHGRQLVTLERGQTAAETLRTGALEVFYDGQRLTFVGAVRGVLYGFEAEPAGLLMRRIRADDPRPAGVALTIPPGPAVRLPWKAFLESYAAATRRPAEPN